MLEDNIVDRLPDVPLPFRRIPVILASERPGV